MGGGLEFTSLDTEIFSDPFVGLDSGVMPSVKNLFKKSNTFLNTILSNELYTKVVTT